MCSDVSHSSQLHCTALQEADLECTAECTVVGSLSVYSDMPNFKHSMITLELGFAGPTAASSDTMIPSNNVAPVSSCDKH